MNDLQVFANPEFGEIRTVEVNGEPWFIGKDVATALGYSDAFGALKKHVDDEDKLVCQIDSAGQKRDVTVINESGLYSLLLSSKLPSAKKFKRWVTSEVLPSIRRTGAYAPQDAAVRAMERIAGCMETMVGQFAALSQRVDALEKQPAAHSSAQRTLAETPVEMAGFMNSIEIARIVGRPHNNVLKGIRATVERARSEGIPIDEHFVICHRTHWNNLLFPYYCLDETGIAIFSHGMKDWTLAEKLRSAFKEKNG